MERMSGLFLSISMTLAIIVMSVNTSSAADTVKTLNQKLALKKDICTAVKECIEEQKGIYTKETVKISLNMGYALCYVVKCALDAGGTLSQTVLGAQEAGFTEDAVESCAVDREYPYTQEAGYKQKRDEEKRPFASPSRF